MPSGYDAGVKFKTSQGQVLPMNKFRDNLFELLIE